MPGFKKELKALKIREDWAFDGRMGTSRYSRNEALFPDDTEYPEDEGMSTSAWDPFASPVPDPTAGPVKPWYEYTKNEVHTAIEAAGAIVPRYLFRAWSSRSGGDAALNTTEAITPLAFLNTTDGTSHIFEMDSARLRGLISSHLMHDRVPTVFSSWSHSLGIVWRIASGFHPNYHTAAHISVVDTYQLDAKKYACHCGAKALERIALGSFEEEFLIFGVVQGAAHRAVPYKQLEEYAARVLPDAYFYDSPLAPKSVARRKIKRAVGSGVSAAAAFGNLFGPEFMLPMTLSLLALQRDISKEASLHKMLMDCEAPSTWFTDSEFPMLPVEEYYPEHAMAAKTMAVMLARLVKAGRISEAGEMDKKTLKQKTASTSLQQGDEMHIDTPESDEQTIGNEKHGDGSVRRLTKALKNLQVDMVDYQKHNEAIAKELQ